MADKDFPPRKGPKMATHAPVRPKSAKDELLDSFGELIDQAEGNMTAREFKGAAKKSSKALDRAIDRRKLRSESA